jgi:(S)-2-hydroxy-acid oxidase
MAHRGESFHQDVSCIADLKALGSSRLPGMVRGTNHFPEKTVNCTLTLSLADYYNEGAMDLITLRDNEAAFDRYKILPRVLINVASVDTSTEILGTKVYCPMPEPQLG